MAGPSDHRVASCHAEVHAIKYALSLKRIARHRKGKRSNATLLVTRWTKRANTDTWQLEDGVPCLSCLRFMEANGVHNIMISCKEDGQMHRASVATLRASSKLSRGTA